MKCEKNKIYNFGQVANEDKFNKKTKICYKFTPSVSNVFLRIHEAESYHSNFRLVLFDSVIMSF